MNHFRVVLSLYLIHSHTPQKSDMSDFLLQNHNTFLPNRNFSLLRGKMLSVSTTRTGHLLPVLENF